MSEIREKIHELFGVKEPHELPAAMMAVVNDSTKLSAICAKYKYIFPDTAHDYLRDYFQENQADRSNLMQDYTPQSICQIVAEITGKRQLIADLCAGTGSLTLEAWRRNPDSEFICYELSSASVPFLCFNLAVRNVSAWVVHGDLLTDEVQAVYRVHDGTVTEVEGFPRDKVDAVITNPPYSLKWSGAHDIRFGSYSVPPKKAADYAFVLIGLDMLKDDGIMSAILPDGVLFRGRSEADIRKQLLCDHRVSAVIGLPRALFAATDIPVAVMVFRNHSDDLLVINAKNEMTHRLKQNIMEPQHIETVISAYKMRRDIDKLAHVATYQELEEYEFNLNIPRYVSDFEEEVLAPPCETIRAIINRHKEIKQQKLELLEMMKQMQAENVETGKKFREFVELFEEWANL